MRTNLRLIATAMATIFFRTNLLVCITANSDNLISPVTETESPAKLDSQTFIYTSSNNNLDADPLPANIFTAEVSDLLSPDMFWQANPLVYFLKKTKKIPYERFRSIRVNVRRIIEMAEPQFLQRYIPYAELVDTLLLCLSMLRDIEESIVKIQSDRPSLLPDIFNQDPIISPLFSSYIFSDKNPPNRLLYKLTEIPKNELDSARARLQRLLNHRYFPRLYSYYTKNLLYFFKAGDFFLRNLRAEVIKMRKTTSSIPQDKLQIDNEIDLPAEDPDTSTQLSEKPTAAIYNNASDTNNSSNRTFKREVRNFLSPDMFSNTNPVAYFLTKASKLSKDVLRLINYHVTNYLDHGEFPPRYIPYAELASSILSCLVQLENINEFIENYQRTASYNSYFSSRDVPKFSPELSKFFSNDIFAKGNPRSRILIKLLDIPDDKISNLARQLEVHLNDRSFPARYQRYAHLLMEVLRCDYLILRLKDNIAEIRRTPMLDSSTPQTLDQLISTTAKKMKPPALSSNSNGTPNFAMPFKFQRLPEFRQKMQ